LGEIYNPKWANFSVEEHQKALTTAQWELLAFWYAARMKQQQVIHLFHQSLGKI
jgi:hypothetical protein